MYRVFRFTNFRFNSCLLYTYVTIYNYKHILVCYSELNYQLIDFVFFHREHDKDPESFFSALFQLADDGYYQQCGTFLVVAAKNGAGMGISYLH